MNANNNCRVMAVINDKGGVAKTTTVMNLGTALWLLGKRVLLIDNDPQCNLTLVCDKTAINTSPNLLTWMMDKNSEIPICERYDGLDYIPGQYTLDNLNRELQDRAGGDRQMSIRISILRPHYDFILIDCAPGCNSLLNLNAMEAADELIIPIRSDIFSVAGRGKLMTKVEEIRELGNDLRVAGVLLTQYDSHTEMGKSVKEYYKQVASENSDMPLFSVQIRKCESVNKVHNSQQSIYESYASSTAADDYMRLAELLTGNTTRRKSWTPVEWGRRSSDAFKAFIATQENS